MALSILTERFGHHILTTKEIAKEAKAVSTAEETPRGGTDERRNSF